MDRNDSVQKDRRIGAFLEKKAKRCGLKILLE